MNKEEILQEIEKTKQHLANMEKILEKCEYERWKPEDFSTYFYVDSCMKIEESEFYNDTYIHSERYNTYSTFKTKEEAETEAEKILVRRQLEDIARRLNRGEEFNWSDENQYKWYIVYNTTFGFATYSASENTVQGVVYCLDKNFLNTAIKEIGEERLIKYLRSE